MYIKAHGTEMTYIVIALNLFTYMDMDVTYMYVYEKLTTILNRQDVLYYTWCE